MEILVITLRILSMDIWEEGCIPLPRREPHAMVLSNYHRDQVPRQVLLPPEDHRRRTNRSGNSPLCQSDYSFQSWP